MESPIYNHMVGPSCNKHCGVGSEPLYCEYLFLHKLDAPSQVRVAPCCYGAPLVQGCKSTIRGPYLFHVRGYPQVGCPQSLDAPQLRTSPCLVRAANEPLVLLMSTIPLAGIASIRPPLSGSPQHTTFL